MALLFIGMGIGAMASQLGAVVVSAVPESEAPEIGGLQNTVNNLGASMGTALVGSRLVAVLGASLLSGIQANPQIPAAAKQQAEVKLQGGIPFLSDADLRAAVDEARVPEATANQVVEENTKARDDGLRVALSAVMLVGILGLFLRGALPRRAVGEATDPPPARDGPAPPTA